MPALIILRQACLPTGRLRTDFLLITRIKGTFSLSNADDWIGGYICTFQLTTTGLQKSFRLAFNYTNPNGPKPVLTNSNTAIYKFGGDGSTYVAKLIIGALLNRH
jgi:hypothetical protein